MWQTEMSKTNMYAELLLKRSLARAILFAHMY